MIFPPDASVFRLAERGFFSFRVVRQSKQGVTEGPDKWEFLHTKALMSHKIFFSHTLCRSVFTLLFGSGLRVVRKFRNRNRFRSLALRLCRRSWPTRRSFVLYADGFVRSEELSLIQIQFVSPLPEFSTWILIYGGNLQVVSDRSTFGQSPLQPCRGSDPLTDRPNVSYSLRVHLLKDTEILVCDRVKQLSSRHFARYFEMVGQSVER